MKIKAFYNKYACSLGQKIDRLVDWSIANPGKTVGLTLVPADLLMLSSGIMFNNWGRIASALMFVAGDTPLAIWGDRVKKDEQQFDPQDMPFAERMKEHWKFWKHPWEFQATTAFLPLVLMTFFAGPDTVSQVGEATNTNLMVSSDSFRPGEAFCGVVGMLALAIMYLKEEAPEKNDADNDDTKRGIRSLRTEFNALVGFTKDRYSDLRQNGVGPRGLKAIFQNAASAISRAGPNTVAAKLFLLSTIPYGVEGAARGDWKMAMGCAAFAVSCWFMAQTSKRLHIRSNEKGSNLPSEPPISPP